MTFKVDWPVCQVTSPLFKWKCYLTHRSAKKETQKFKHCATSWFGTAKKKKIYILMSLVLNKEPDLTWNQITWKSESSTVLYSVSAGSLLMPYHIAARVCPSVPRPFVRLSAHSERRKGRLQQPLLRVRHDSWSCVRAARDFSSVAWSCLHIWRTKLKIFFFLRASSVTRGWKEHGIRVSTES